MYKKGKEMDEKLLRMYSWGRKRMVNIKTNKAKNGKKRRFCEKFLVKYFTLDRCAKKLMWNQNVLCKNHKKWGVKS